MVKVSHIQSAHCWCSECENDFKLASLILGTRECTVLEARKGLTAILFLSRLNVFGYVCLAFFLYKLVSCWDA